MKTKSEFGRSFQLLCQRAKPGATQRELALWLGVKQSVVSDYFNGKKLPSAGHMIEFAGKLGVSVDELVRGENGANAAPDSAISRRQVPVIFTLSAINISWNDCRPLVGEMDGARMFVDVESMALVCKQASPESFAVVIKGDSLGMFLRAGHAVLVDPGVDPLPDDLVLIERQDGKVAIVTLISRAGGRASLLDIEGNRLSLADEEIGRILFVAGVLSPRLIKTA